MPHEIRKEVIPDGNKQQSSASDRNFPIPKQASEEQHATDGEDNPR